MEPMTFGSDDHALLKLDPRTKLFLFLTCTLMTINTFNMTPVVLYNTALCAVLALCGRPWTALKAFVLLMVTVYVRVTVNAQGSVAPATLTIVFGLATLVLFCFPVILSFSLLVRTTRISQFLAGFQAMHLPVRVVIPVAVMIRFIPTVQEEWAGIRKAMAFRDIRTDIGSVVLHPMRTVEYVLIPLLFSCIAVMEELAAAALARGMDADRKRSSYETVRMRIQDYVVIVVFCALLVYVMMTRFGAM